MGWNCTRYDKTAQNGLAEFFSGRRTPGTDEHTGPSGQVTEIAASSLVGRCEWYAVLRFREQHGPFGPWFGIVTLIQWAPNAHHNICFKTIECTQGPVESRAPRQILETLDRLAPLKPIEPANLSEHHRWQALFGEALQHHDHSAVRKAGSELHALDPDRSDRLWRARCWTNIHAKESRTPVKVGDVIRLATPLTFVGLGTLDTFLVNVAPTGTGLRLTLPDREEVSFKLPDWRDLPFEVTERRGITRMATLKAREAVRRQAELDTDRRHMTALGYTLDNKGRIVCSPPGTT